MTDVTIIIFGVTGDLARRKLLPSIYRLIHQKKLTKFAIVGAAIEQTSSAAILESAHAFTNDIEESAWQQMQQQMIYERVDFLKEDDFVKLAHRVTEIEKKYALSGNRLIYMAAASEFFCPITTHIATAKLAQRKKEGAHSWHRIVYEKPFGHDLASAHEINECIKHRFEEHQIYRIDHFLTKELVSNIALVRFTNCVFEPLWNNRYVDHVQIIISETLGIENRGAYYDKYGALADVMQNHMLELLALIGMESPEKLTGNFIRSKRIEVLKKVEVVDGLLGQFESYKQAKFVNPSSTTETFAALFLRINNPRWAGVPFYVKTGKCLKKKETVIHIKFKQVDCLLTHHCPVPSNWLTLEVFPSPTFSLSLNVKKPGRSEEVVPVAMEFCHSCLFEETMPEAYEIILEEVMHGEQSISVRFDEIEWAWRIIDEVRARRFPLYTYACGSEGPTELETEFEKKHGMRWRS
jgi:glucose-6-phosphate 1-dehydrogenase